MPYLLSLGIFLAVFLLLLILDSLWRRVKPGLLDWILDPRRSLGAEHDPRWNREYTRRSLPSSEVSASPKPG